MSAGPCSIMSVNIFHVKYLLAVVYSKIEIPTHPQCVRGKHLTKINRLGPYCNTQQLYYTLERRAYFFKCFTISSAALASHSNKCPPLCWYNMTSYSTRPWKTNRTNRDGHYCTNTTKSSQPDTKIRSETFADFLNWMFQWPSEWKWNVNKQYYM